MYCVQLFNCIVAAADPSAINVYAIHFSLVGMMLLYPSNILRTFGIKFGLSVVALPLVFYSRSKRTAREGLRLVAAKRS